MEMHDFVIIQRNYGSSIVQTTYFPSFYICREARVRELVQVLLRLITGELALEKITLGS